MAALLSSLVGLLAREFVCAKVHRAAAEKCLRLGRFQGDAACLTAATTAFYGLAAPTSRGLAAWLGASGADMCERGNWHTVLTMARALALGSPLWLAACGASLDDSRAGLSCIDDSTQCVGARQATLKAMLADTGRAWVKEAPTPQAHASGVRLFAFRSTKAILSCEELAHGR